MKLFSKLFLFLALPSLSYSQYCNISVSPMDTTICLGDSVLMTAQASLVTVGNGQQFNFNSGNIPAGWTTAGGNAYGTPCGQNPSGTPYYWASTAGTGTTPQITTASFDISCGGLIIFDMRYAVQSGPAPCEGPDLPNEGVELQYSTNGGTTWVPIEYYHPNGTTLPQNPGTTTPQTSGATAWTTWSTLTVPIPAAALGTNTRFRWVQQNSSSSANDNWGLDNIIISASGLPCNPTTVINWTNGVMNSESYYLTPTNDSTFIAMVYDTLGNFQCQSQPINIHIFPDVMTYSLVDTVYSYCPTTNPAVTVTNFGGTFGPWGVNWPDIPSVTNPTNLSSGGAMHDTLLYYVEVTDGCNYIRYDSVVLIVNQKLEIDTLYSFPSLVCDPDGAVSAVVSGLTTTSGQPFYNWTGPNLNPGPISVDGTVMEDLPPGWYYFTVIDNVCRATDSVYVEPLDPPVAQFSPNTNSGCSPLQVTFTNSSQNTNNYYWDFGNGNTTTVGNTNSQNQTYTSSTTVMLVASSSPLCADTAYASISIVTCGCTDPLATNYDPTANSDDGNCEYPSPEVYPPNVFTPNGDANNAFFILDTRFVVQLELTILNRWGNVMYFADEDITIPGNFVGWDGKSPNGKNAEEGTYFYKYVATGIVGQKTEGHGFLELIRD